MKVFEFAKEIGIETILLMDKIREWKLPVKSHMASLDEETMTAIKTKLEEEKEATQPKKKAKTKAAATDTPKAKKATVETKTVTKAVTVKTLKKTASIEPEAEEAAPVTKKIIKKKAVAPAPAAEPEVVEADKNVSSDTLNAVREKRTVVTKKAPIAGGAGMMVRRKAGDATGVTVVTEPKIEEQTEDESNFTDSDSSESERSATGEVAASLEEKTDASVPAAPPKKRNIIGRMDLSKARPMNTQSSGSASGDRNNPRPSATNTRNIRTGFFAPTPFVDDPARGAGAADEDRKDKFKDKRPVAPKEKEKEEEVVVFNAADFRKREVIFQPKKKKQGLKGDMKKTQITTPKASKRIIKVENTMTVSELANAMGLKAPVLVKKLMQGGVMATMNTSIDFDTISLMVTEFGFEAVNVHKTADDILKSLSKENADIDLIKRPPVVTVMGHVDHGKTSLLDAIRKANVASGEAGGITQHIGAYQVQVEGGELVTFIDTPGHEAFTAMRARGANVTDIAIIVVAADDGVMPQTAEAINHAKAAEVPIIIAVNKIDKPGGNVDRIKQQLTEFQIVPEEWGGTNIFCEVSALKKTGVKELLEQILLVAEVEDLKANPNRPATGVVIEARLDKGRGTVATVLVKDGTLKVGNHIVVGKVAGRVRNMLNDVGVSIKEAGPGMPVEIMGLSGNPLAGDTLDVVLDEADAVRVVEARVKEDTKQIATGKDAVSLEQLFAKVQKGDTRELNVVVKADVSGSVEALKGMLEKASTDIVKVKIIHSSVGAVSESDVLLASTSNALILAFNVRPDTSALRSSKDRNVEIKTYSIIYELLDDVKKAMTGLLKPIVKEVIQGRAEIREVFGVPKIGNIAGCTVVLGKITRSDSCRIIRDGKVAYEGKFSSLRRFKDDVKEVANGFECGISIENYNDIKVGDTIEAFTIEETAGQL
jgi:translation initiation factor IF-2